MGANPSATVDKTFRLLSDISSQFSKQHLLEKLLSDRLPDSIMSFRFSSILASLMGERSFCCGSLLLVYLCVCVCACLFESNLGTVNLYAHCRIVLFFQCVQVVNAAGQLLLHLWLQASSSISNFDRPRGKSAG